MLDFGTRTLFKSLRSASRWAVPIWRLSWWKARTWIAGSGRCNVRPPRRPGSSRLWRPPSITRTNMASSTAMSNRPTCSWPPTERRRSLFLFAKGLAEYRVGRFEAAIALMNGEAARVMGPGPRLVVAMAKNQQGAKGGALKTLAEAVLSDNWRAEKADNRESPWIIHVLRREAEGADPAQVLPSRIAPISCGR